MEIYEKNYIFISDSCSVIGNAFRMLEISGRGFPFQEGRTVSACMVGVWKSNDFGWGFKFEPDGSIKKLRHMLAREVNMDEGAVEMQGPEEGTYALFVMGDCKTNYEPKKRLLEVTVVLEHYEMVLPNGVLEGNSVDYFTGRVSRDCKTWKVDWYPRGWLKGSDPVDPDEWKFNKHPLTFTKLDLSNPPAQPTDPNTIQ